MIEHNGKQYKITQRRIVWTRSMDDKLRVMRDAGKLVPVIAKSFKYGETVIYRRLKVLNLVDTPWTIKEDRLLLSDQYTDKELAQMTGTNIQYIRDRITYLKTLAKRQ